MTVASTVYQAIIAECIRLEADWRYVGSSHHLAQRLAQMVADDGKLVTTHEAGEALAAIVAGLTGAPWRTPAGSGHS